MWRDRKANVMEVLRYNKDEDDHKERDVGVLKKEMEDMG